MLAGGASRIPRIQQMIHDFFGRTNLIDMKINTDEATVIGCAMEAAK